MLVEYCMKRVTKAHMQLTNYLNKSVGWMKCIIIRIYVVSYYMIVNCAYVTLIYIQIKFPYIVYKAVLKYIFKLYTCL